MTEKAILVDGVISKGGSKLQRINHPTDTLDDNFGHYHGNYIGWRSRSKFLQDVIEVRGGTKFVDQVGMIKYV